jgi:hypothetical protein
VVTQETTKEKTKTTTETKNIDLTRFSIVALDSEARTDQPLLLVGGPCANELSAEAMSNPKQ